MRDIGGEVIMVTDLWTAVLTSIVVSLVVSHIATKYVFKKIWDEYNGRNKRKDR